MRYNRISIVLDELEIDQKDLAKLLTVTKDTVSRWCRNENQPSIPVLYKIALMLQVDVFRLLEPLQLVNTDKPSLVEKLLAEKKKEKEKKAAPSKKKKGRTVSK